MRLFGQRRGIYATHHAMSPPGAYRYWRLFFTDYNDTVQHKYISISEINFRTTLGVNNPMVGAKTASSFFTDTQAYVANNAADNDPNTVWITNAGQQVNSWWQITFDVAQEVKQVMLQAFPNAFGAGQMMKSGYLQRSTNGNTWVDVLPILNQTNWAPSEIRTFDVL
ncbi:F5/8 type C domain protein [compost metagenome]